MWKTQSENIKPKCRVPKVHNHVTPYENIAEEREIAPYKQLYHFPVVCFSMETVMCRREWINPFPNNTFLD